MASVKFIAPVDRMHGKGKKTDEGYYYASPSGKRCFRTRVENYQQNQTLRQKWNSASFAAAQHQLKLFMQQPDADRTIYQQWMQAKKRNPETGRAYPTARGWKFSMLQSEWRLENPFDAWAEAYLESVRETVVSKTEAADLRPSTIDKEIALLQKQIASLYALKAQKK